MSAIAVEPDHLVVAALELDQGCNWVEQQLGVRPQPGGKHVAMGTHNALLHLGPRFFLEMIAVDPDGVKPARPRWFDLDEPRMKAALAEGPHLVHWVVRTTDIDAAVARIPDLGTATPTVRAPRASLGLSDTLKVTYAKSPRLAAMIRTARGVATLERRGLGPGNFGETWRCAICPPS